MSTAATGVINISNNLLHLPVHPTLTLIAYFQSFLIRKRARHTSTAIGVFDIDTVVASGIATVSSSFAFGT